MSYETLFVNNFLSPEIKVCSSAIYKIFTIVFTEMSHILNFCCSVVTSSIEKLNEYVSAENLTSPLAYFAQNLHLFRLQWLRGTKSQLPRRRTRVRITAKPHDIESKFNYCYLFRHEDMFMRQKLEMAWSHIERKHARG
jgi:hypothetical protein